MDAERFDSLTRRLADLQSRRRLLGGALRGIVAGAAAVVTGASLGRAEAGAKKRAKAARNKGGEASKGGKKAKGGKTKSQGQPKVSICHKGKTIRVAQPAVPAHLRHGDTVGRCEAPPPECTTPATCPAPPQLCAVATCVDGTCGSRPKAAGTTCRAAAGECDVAEVCNGTALDCPANQFKPNNTPCSGGSCQNGRCAACAAETKPCMGDEACCDGVCCLGLDPVGECCTSGERCCSGQCCVGERRVCDFRFTMCVTCRVVDEFCNELIVCCPGLRCDIGAQVCVPV